MRPEPSPKIRLKALFRKSFDVWRADFAQSVFWSEKDGFGERIEPGLDFFREDDFNATPLINIKFEIIIGSFTRL